MPGKAISALTIATLLLVAVGATGCVEDDSGPPETFTPTTLTIDFDGKGGSINPGNVTTWDMVDGEWEVSVGDGHGVTVYRFLNISADNCLGQIECAAELAGFDVHRTYFSVPGGWLIEGIDGLETEVPGPAWQFWVNGEYSSHSVDQVNIGEGDEVEWRYQPSAF